MVEDAGPRCEFELFEGLGESLRRVGHIQIGTHLVPQHDPLEALGLDPN